MALPLAGIDTASPRPLTQHKTPVAWWRFSKDGRRLFFTAPDSIDQLNRQRLEKKFDVRIRNQDIPLNHLWMVDVATGNERRLTQGEAFSVEAVTLSDDGAGPASAAIPTTATCAPPWKAETTVISTSWTSKADGSSG
jgi:dipeptidyl aminopeptidase/acylaminoacyl peptidase